MKFSVIVSKVDCVATVQHFKTNADAAKACALAMYAFTGDILFNVCHPEYWKMGKHCVGLGYEHSLKLYSVRIERA